jgi:hypothetical protein
MKLSKSEMQALEKLLSYILALSATTIETKLVVCILKKFYIKIARALVELKPAYKIKMDDDVALAFALAFEDAIFDEDVYTRNLVLKLSNDIKQYYSKPETVSIQFKN